MHQKFIIEAAVIPITDEIDLIYIGHWMDGSQC
jgi:hypothetical protein